MRRFLLLYTLVFLASFLGGAFPAAPAHAITVDEAVRQVQTGRRVYDFAGLLSLPEAARVDARIDELKARGLAEGAVVILDRLDGVTIEEFALQFGERAGIGSRRTGNGIVVAISVADRKWRVEVGRDLQGTLTDAVVTRLGRDILVPGLRSGNVGPALEQLFTEFETRLDAAGGLEALPERAPVPGVPAGLTLLSWLMIGGTAIFTFRSWPRGSVPGKDPSRLPTILFGLGSLTCALFGVSQSLRPASGLILATLPAAGFATLRLLEGSRIPIPMDNVRPLASRWVGVFVAVTGILLVAAVVVGQGGWVFGITLAAIPFGFALKRYVLHAPRRCPQCAGALRWLPEAEEAQYLQPDENAEQQLGSVDYDLWRCDRCEKTAVFAKPNFYGSHATCPKCGRRTLATRTELVREPTRRYAGSAREITECRNPKCDYHDSRPIDVDYGGYRDDGFGGIVIVPPIFIPGGGGWGHHGGGGSRGDDGGWFGGGGDYGGFGDFDGGGGGGDW